MQILTNGHLQKKGVMCRLENGLSVSETVSVTTLRRCQAFPKRLKSAQQIYRLYDTVLC